jgi:alpha-N-arabinofuranosidase
VDESGRLRLHLKLAKPLRDARTTLVTTALLGKAKIPGLPYVNCDDSPLKLDRDYFGRRRSASRPTPGPFEQLPEEKLKLVVW